MKISLGNRFKRLTATLAAFAALAAVPASAQAIQLGAYTPGAPADAKALSAYNEMVGRQPDIVMWFRDFGQPLMWSNEIANLKATGQTPMITWMPYQQKLSSIAAGDYDAYLRESAKIAKSWGGTLQIRFAHEQNGDWFPWGADGATSSEFVEAWRHIVSIFRADGATNVKWVWSPNIQEGTKYEIAPTFPGDEWIDYVGLDGYNWGDKWSATGFTQLDGVFAASYGIVTQLSAKPVMITETSSSESGGDKAQWIKTGFMSLLPKLFPRVEAVVWFNRIQEDDWRINSSQASLDAYRAVVNCSIYGGTGPCDGGVVTPLPTKKKKPKLRDLRVTRRVPDQVNSGKVSYAIDQPAEVEITIIPKGRAAKKIVVSRKSRPGRNRVPLKRLLRKRHLPEGSYRVVITAKDDEGQRSRPRKARFRVV
ncbi:MAG TPA: glycosyl hydrolase [Solirubrobacterales bacterium]|nr:glycosyl hydrolase [Solirubrobacterales bacterium]